jgi:hypothetical protein
MYIWGSPLNSSKEIANERKKNREIGEERGSDKSRQKHGCPFKMETVIFEKISK